MKIHSMQELLLHELKDLLSAERQITKGLPKMIKIASTDRLKQMFQEHLDQTHNHIQRLEQVFEHLGKTPRAETCKGMMGLIAEGDEVAAQIEDPMVRDAALISAAQRVEHYEMCAYGTARTFAEQLGHSEAAELLQQTLDEEKETDEKLTELATSDVNVHAPQ